MAFSVKCFTPEVIEILDGVKGFVWGRALFVFKIFRNMSEYNHECGG
jgi:hypothetical protein